MARPAVRGARSALLAGAFLLYARHAADYERIELAGGRVMVEVADGMSKTRYELEARRGDGKGRVVLRNGKQQLEIGRYLGAEARAELAAG